MLRNASPCYVQEAAELLELRGARTAAYPGRQTARSPQGWTTTRNSPTPIGASFAWSLAGGRRGGVLRDRRVGQAEGYAERARSHASEASGVESASRGGEVEAHTYVYSDRAGCHEIARSTGSFVSFIAGSLVRFSSSTQTVVAKSSAEAELGAIQRGATNSAFLANV